MDKGISGQDHAILHRLDSAQVFDALNMGVVILSRDFSVLHWNQWMEIHSGISRQSITGKPLFTFYPALNTDSFRRRVKSVFKFGNYSYFSNELHGCLLHMKNTNPVYPSFKYMQQSCTIGPVRAGDNSITSACISIFDVTDRVGSEIKIKELMREKAERDKQSILHTALKAFPDAVAITAMDGTVIDMNPGFTSLTGYSRENLIGKKTSEVGMWDPPEQRNSAYEAVTRNGFISNFLATMRTKSGDLKEILFSAITVDMDGSKVMLSLAKDITLIKKADDDLMRLKKAIETIPLGVTISDKEGRIVYTNPAEAYMHGYTPQELIGRNAKTLAPSVKHSKEEMDILNRKDVWKRETLNIKRDDTVFPVQLTSVGVSSADGEITHVITVCEDITERRNTDRAIRLSEERYKRLYAQFNALLDAISYPIMLVSGDFEILWKNSSAYKLASSDDVVKCHKLFFDLDSPCQYCLAHSSAASGEAESTSVLTRDDRVVDVKCFPILNSDGKPESFIEIMTDITDQLKMQADAARVSHLVELGEIAAGVAHEVNSPINCIINYAEMLQSSPEPSDVSDIAGRLIREGEFVANIVKNLLAYSRGASAENEEFSIFEALDTILTFVEPQLKKCNIKVLEEFDDNVPYIHGNKHRIMQVLLNLINNAKDALNSKYPSLHDDKIIVLGCKTYESDGKAWITISFKDHGVGIEGDILGRVKDAFFTLKSSGSGTGLGLSISNSIVEEHGGRLDIESEPGSYTLVSIHLPLRRDG